MSWLKEISRSSSLRDGRQVRDLNVHCYRHTLAMRYRRRGEPLERVATIFGDTVATVEGSYSESVFPAEDERAFHRVNSDSRRFGSEGTSQPGFLTRDESLMDQRLSRGMDSRLNGGRWGI